MKTSRNTKRCLKRKDYISTLLCCLQLDPGFLRLQSQRSDRRHDREGRRHIKRREVRRGASRVPDEAGTQEGCEGPDRPDIFTDRASVGENRT